MKVADPSEFLGHIFDPPDPDDPDTPIDPRIVLPGLCVRNEDKLIGQPISMVVVPLIEEYGFDRLDKDTSRFSYTKARFWNPATIWVSVHSPNQSKEKTKVKPRASQWKVDTSSEATGERLLQGWDKPTIKDHIEGAILRLERQISLFIEALYTEIAQLKEECREKDVAAKDMEKQKDETEVKYKFAVAAQSFDKGSFDFNMMQERYKREIENLKLPLIVTRDSTSASTKWFINFISRSGLFLVIEEPI